MDLAHSSRALDLIERVQSFVDELIVPAEDELVREIDQSEGDWSKWSVSPVIEDLKEGWWRRSRVFRCMPAPRARPGSA